MAITYESTQIGNVRASQISAAPGVGASLLRFTLVLVADERDFEGRWKTAVDALEQSINLLKHPQEFGVSSQYLLMRNEGEAAILWFRSVLG
jgi:hypothetical protein